MEGKEWVWEGGILREQLATQTQKRINTLVDQKRLDEKETAKREIRFDHIARSIKKNEDFINVVNQKHQDLPKTIRKVIGHIEFAKPINKKTNI